MNINVKDSWITDVSQHITYRLEWFNEYYPSNEKLVSLGDNGVCEVLGSKTIIIDKLIGDTWCESHIKNVLYRNYLKFEYLKNSIFYCF